jgi:hypothetical protein
MTADLAALTPPLVVCAGFIIGLVLLVRHQMAPKRRDAKDRSQEPE